MSKQSPEQGIHLFGCHYVMPTFSELTRFVLFGCIFSWIIFSLIFNILDGSSDLVSLILNTPFSSFDLVLAMIANLVILGCEKTSGDFRRDLMRLNSLILPFLVSYVILLICYYLGV